MTDTNEQPKGHPDNPAPEKEGILWCRQVGDSKFNLVDHVARVNWSNTKVEVQFKSIDLALETIQNMSCSGGTFRLLLKVGPNIYANFGPCIPLGPSGSTGHANTHLVSLSFAPRFGVTFNRGMPKEADTPILTHSKPPPGGYHDDSEYPRNGGVEPPID